VRNEYSPVGVVWRSNPNEKWGLTEGREDRGGLYWSPKDLAIPSIEKFFYPEGDYPKSKVRC
jgi:hypothetical protein